MNSQQLFEAAQKHLIGGAGAGGRYHPLLERPLYLKRGKGSRMWDVDGKEFIDFFTGSGANFLGHAHPAIHAAIRQALDIGVICNGETEYHSQLADLVAEAVPCAEKIRFANSGTEATMGALRIARAYTRKPKILKFEGHFHGMHDYLWHNCATAMGQRRDDGTITPIPDADGTPGALSDLILVVPFNDGAAFEKAVTTHRDELAAVILEPIAYNLGCVPGDPEFLRQVRRTCTDAGLVLIFDEVLSGFRMCRGGAQAYYGVTPDLCTLAKALGGGVPIAAVCGKTEIMSVLNPLGGAVMSGTYTGHLTAVMGALACQTELARPGFYEHINALADRLYRGIREALRVTGVPGIVQGIGARFGLYLGVTEPVTSYRDATRSSREMEVKFLLGCLKRGLYLHDYAHPTPMHHGFSSQHTIQDIDQALNIMEDSLKDLRRA
ncbi:MAG TPA: aspartate aminotransferase family protein [Candidatus Methylomirabilis sp.]|nr:aspartate aminotransferase family protein [Candidatus Methylomirabilis sp.]